ncbi:MAG: OmpA family protein [Acidimicrobiia bacterium]|nr:OmpA family protein [Acidimicrobiia bacterium]
MLDRLRNWLSDDSPGEDDDSGWGLSLWWGAVIVALFTVAISICNDPGADPAIASPATTVPGTPTTSAAPVPSEATILDIIDGRSDLTFFRSMIAVAGIEQSLMTDRFTFFAPTDEAFAELDQETRDALLSSDQRAIPALRAHVTIDLFMIEDLAEFGFVPVATPAELPVTEENGTFFVAGAEVLEPNLRASNGVVHIVDSFLGTGVTGETPGEPPPPEPPSPDTPVSQIISDRADLTTLLAALRASGDESLLEAGEEGFTVFAPNNEAFALLPAGSVEVLLETQPKLVELLGFHVVSGRVTSADLTDGQVLVTSNGADLTVAIEGDSITVGGATITEADIEGADGVIHIVSGVLLPPEFELPTINEALALDPITFQSGSATITDEGIAVLQRAVEFLTANPDVRVAIEGHTDSAGSESGNQALSEARAVAVRDYLVTQGIEDLRLETAGFGESRPIADNGTSAGRAQNRRIEFRLLG